MDKKQSSKDKWKRELHIRPESNRHRSKSTFEWDKLHAMLPLKPTARYCAQVMGIAEETIHFRIKMDKGVTYDEYREIFLAPLKNRLFNKMVDMAINGDRVMLIWLSKNLLGYKEKVEVEQQNTFRAEVTYVAEWGSNAEPTTIDVTNNNQTDEET